MFRSSRFFAAAVPLAVLAACNDNDGNFVHVTNFAVVQFVNATDLPVTVVGNGVIDTVNINIPFGAHSSCLLIDLANTTPILFTNSATGATITFSSTLFLGGNFTVIAFAGANSSVVQFATLSNHFIPVPGAAGLRLFNAASASGTLFIDGNGVPLTTTGAGFGASTGFFSVSSDPFHVTVNNGSTTVVDAGTQQFPLGQNSTFVVGPAAAGTTPLRFFTTPGC